MQVREEEFSEVPPTAPMTQFESEIEEILDEILREDLPSVAKRRGILLTKTGKVDKRTCIGRVLFSRLEEIEK